MSFHCLFFVYGYSRPKTCDCKTTKLEQDDTVTSRINLSVDKLIYVLIDKLIYGRTVSFRR